MYKLRNFYDKSYSTDSVSVEIYQPRRWTYWGKMNDGKIIYSFKNGYELVITSENIEVLNGSKNVTELFISKINNLTRHDGEFDQIFFHSLLKEVSSS